MSCISEPYYIAQIKKMEQTLEGILDVMVSLVAFSMIDLCLRSGGVKLGQRL